MTGRPATIGPIELDGAPVGSEQAAALALISYGHFGVVPVDEELRVQGLDLHLERLVRDCAEVFGAELDRDQVQGLLRQVALGCRRPVLLRATVIAPTGSVARPGLPADDPQARPSVLISSRAAAVAGSSPGLRVRTTNFVRNLPTVKHLGAFGQLHERRLAQQAGFDDALFCTGPEPTARVCEGTTWNIAVLIGDDLIWPDDQCLPGVTREMLRPVIGPTDAAGTSRSVTRADLADARAAFATSAGIGVVPITAIDGRELPGDPGWQDALTAAYTAYPATPL